jgi:hypothetical protein
VKLIVAFVLAVGCGRSWANQIVTDPDDAARPMPVIVTLLLLGLAWTMFSENGPFYDFGQKHTFLALLLVVSIPALIGVFVLGYSSE